MKCVYLLLILTILSSCATEESFTIDIEFVPFIENFEEEAKDRGITIVVSEELVSIVFEDIQSADVLGQCLSFSDFSHKIVIDPVTWENLDELGKEYLLFHELGHCILGRSHNDDSDNQGNCVSIMQSGNGDCRKRYNQNNRNLILDELFI